eukprot:CAMPEP_0167811718 /NCGR_PEP_ID=MMETSP0112_2-20121227/832_1 /TAXON_ID=91324 /ORGANISM="Lotharella globosa, Strain CCCM811" /LENGTH=400 /DNA_ID=CAMNT_0007710477 /DNA_START=46 /DNA_END=1245 /DNA_ORIENTATION=-
MESLLMLCNAATRDLERSRSIPKRSRPKQSSRKRKSQMIDVASPGQKKVARERGSPLRRSIDLKKGSKSPPRSIVLNLFATPDLLPRPHADIMNSSTPRGKAFFRPGCLPLPQKKSAPISPGSTASTSSIFSDNSSSFGGRLLDSVVSEESSDSGISTATDGEASENSEMTARNGSVNAKRTDEGALRMNVPQALELTPRQAREILCHRVTALHKRITDKVANRLQQKLAARSQSTAVKAYSENNSTKKVERVCTICQEKLIPNSREAWLACGLCSRGVHCRCDDDRSIFDIYRIQRQSAVFGQKCPLLYRCPDCRKGEIHGAHRAPLVAEAEREKVSPRSSINTRVHHDKKTRYQPQLQKQLSMEPMMINSINPSALCKALNELRALSKIKERAKTNKW